MQIDCEFRLILNRMQVHYLADRWFLLEIGCESRLILNRMQMHYQADRWFLLEIVCESRLILYHVQIDIFGLKIPPGSYFVNPFDWL